MDLYKLNELCQKINELEQKKSDAHDVLLKAKEENQLVCKKCDEDINSLNNEFGEVLINNIKEYSGKPFVLCGASFSYARRLAWNYVNTGKKGDINFNSYLSEDEYKEALWEIEEVDTFEFYEKFPIEFIFSSETEKHNRIASICSNLRTELEAELSNLQTRLEIVKGKLNSMRKT